MPLGDVLNRRRLIVTMMVSSAAALGLCALAPSFEILLLVITLLGLTTVSGQILTPLAGDLADEANRGRVVGTVVSGILTGILASRTISGLVAEAAGWRAIYVLAAAAAVVFAILLFRAVPPLPPKTQMAYPALIASVVSVALRSRTVRWTLVLSATGFGLFTMFGTALTSLLSSPPFNYPVSVIGLFGLAGLAGVVLVIVVVIVLDTALQVIGILNQLRVFAVSHEARSRLNTAYVTTNFIGGAIGSAAAAALWAAGGWAVVSLAGAVFSGLALLVWAAGRRGALVPASSS